MPPRKKANAAIAAEPIAAEPAAVETPKAPAASDASVNGEKSPATPERKFSELPDPRALMTVTLGPSNADPKMQLLRSHRYRQMQMQFDREPDDRHKEMLQNEGWRDRSQDEGIWTKQIPKEGERWRAVADAERLFKQIANEIRADKGLGAVMSL